jgi:FkbH-like protein
MDASHAAWRSPPELLLVWTTPRRAIPSFDALADFRPAAPQALLEEVDQFAEAVSCAAERVSTVFVVSWSLPPHERGVQTLALRPEGGSAYALMTMNLRLAQRLAPKRNVVLLDSGYWHAALQRPSYDPKLHALAKVDYSREFLVKATAEIKAVLRGVLGQSRKLVICDLDNTLWGGIVGDDGLEHVKLGGHDGVGESFLEFQRGLRALKNRGILLAVCSKNDPAVAREMIDRHPEMQLRHSDFACQRINWADKAENVAQILTELNLLPSSAVFLDDSPGERQRIAQAFPEMLVPDLPDDIAQYPAFLAAMDCFETLQITAEDRQRTESYRQEAMRVETQRSAVSLDAWLQSLELKLTVRRLDRLNLPRAAQLLNKTNQFNLATRRLSEEAFWQWSQAPGRAVFTFWVADRFGDAGLTGLISAEIEPGGRAALADFVMSCRVMGKQVETAMLDVAWQWLQSQGATQLAARYLPTPKNRPFAEFIVPRYLDPQAGLLDVARTVRPPHIAVISEVS